ncbi:MAG: zinc ribbon domain-containing protein [Stomatobaculum sp.]|nr:zinc ribbon domain-containing protein [Stomatobaculum sp.]
MKFCKYCGNQLLDTASFCSQCGKEIVSADAPQGASQNAVRMQPQTQICTVCGAPLGAQSKFCRNCGSPAGQSEGGPAPGGPGNQTSAPQNAYRQSSAPQNTYRQSAPPKVKKGFPWKRAFAAALTVAIGYNVVSSVIGTETIERVDFVQPSEPKQVSSDKGSQYLEDFCGDWWSADEDEEIGQVVMRVWEEDKAACMRVNDYADTSDVYKDKKYNIKGGTVLTIKDKKLPEGSVDLIFDNSSKRDRLTATIDGKTRHFIREDAESVKLKKFLGLWSSVYKGIRGGEILAYRDGHLMLNELSHENRSTEGIILDRYVFADSRTIHVYDLGLKGGMVTYQLKDDTHMTSENGEGEISEFTLVESANYMQMKAKKANPPSPDSGGLKPLGSSPVTGQVDLYEKSKKIQEENKKRMEQEKKKKGK